MSAFPSLPWTLDSRERWTDQREVVTATNGARRGRSYQAAKTRAFDLDFKLLSDADKATLEAHYDAHRTLTFDFTWRDGATYTVIYGDKDIDFGTRSATRWSGKITLEEA